MKKNSLILVLLILSFCGYSQDAFYRKIDWTFFPTGVSVVNDSTYQMTAEIYDYNEPGAGLEGNYVVDNVGNRYDVVSLVGGVLTLIDHFGIGMAPQTSQPAKVYQSVGNGEAEYIGSIDYTKLDPSVRWKLNGADNELLWRKIDKKIENPVDSLIFTQQETKECIAGMMYFDSTKNNFVLYDNNSEVSLDVGKEGWIDVYNPTTETILNGSCVVFNGNGGMHPSIKLAKSDIPVNMSSRLGIATHDIESGTYGRMTIWGQVRDYNTVGTTTGQKLYLSPTVFGALTTTKPSFPNTSILIATVDSVGVSGSINVNIIGTPSSVLGNLDNGCFIESFTFSVSSDGTTIKGSLTNKAGDDWLIMKFSDGLDTLDLTSPREINLIAGTDGNPQKQYVYIDESTRDLAVSTSYWLSTEHIPVAEIVVQSAATVQTIGAIRNQNTNNHVADDEGMGGLDHIRKRIRTLYCVYEDGVATTVTGSNITTTGGNAWQMHLQPYDAWDLSTDYAFIPNSPVQNYRIIDALTDITTDGSGGTLKNNEYSIVLIGIQNSGNDPDQMFINVPTGTYNNVSDAILDEEGYSVYTIPNDYRGVGFLIARLTFTNANGVWTLEDTEDLRGSIPNNIAGGGGTSSGGYTTLLELEDFPNAYTGFGSYLMNVSTAENAVEFSEYTTIDLDTIGLNVEGIKSLEDSILAIRADINDLDSYFDSTEVKALPISTFTNDIGYVTTNNYTSNQYLYGTTVYTQRHGLSTLTMDLSPLVGNAETLDNQQPSYYLDYDNFFDTPVLLDVIRESDASPTLTGMTILEFDNSDFSVTNSIGSVATVSYIGSGGSSMIYPSLTGLAYYNSSTETWGTSIINNSTNWNTAYTDRNKWDGGSTGLVAQTGRTSLELKSTVPQSITTSAVCTYYLNFYTTASSDKTIILSGLTNGDCGQIEVVYSAASIITFYATSIIVKIADNIWSSGDAVTSQSSGTSIYSYYYRNSVLYINGTQIYN